MNIYCLVKYELLRCCYLDEYKYLLVKYNLNEQDE